MRSHTGMLRALLSAGIVAVGLMFAGCGSDGHHHHHAPPPAPKPHHPAKPHKPAPKPHRPAPHHPDKPVPPPKH